MPFFLSSFTFLSLCYGFTLLQLATSTPNERINDSEFTMFIYENGVAQVDLSMDLHVDFKLTNCNANKREKKTVTM